MKAAVFALALLLGQAETPAPIIPPDVDQWLRNNLTDYASARIEYLKGPFLWNREEGGIGALHTRDYGETVSYTGVCLRVNVKNRAGAFDGPKPYLFLMTGRFVMKVRRGTAEAKRACLS